MLHFSIAPRSNTVGVGPGPGLALTDEQRFTRRWEALVLVALLEASSSQRALGGATLQSLLQQHGQAKALNRAQLQRLMHSLQAFLGGLPGGGLRIETPPRKSTVGPWRIMPASGWTFEVAGQEPSTQWPYPLLVADNDVHQLFLTLSGLLVADALAVEGRYLSAIEMLPGPFPETLSAEGRGLLLLRLCSWHKHLGQFAAARACAQDVLAGSAPADPGLAWYARFMLERIDYDENPSDSWERLWQTTQAPPGADSAPAGDWRGLAEWHNLRALLTRRRMQALDQDPLAPQDTTAALHQRALRHLQAAVLVAAWNRDWDRLQAYVANLAYHLQAALDMGLGVTARQVLDWHRLTMAYEDKLSAGRDSAWEYIFFGKFWLDKHDQLPDAFVPDPLAHSLDNCSPDQAAFYERALARLRECGDPRQLAIGHSLYLRFAQVHLADAACRTAVLHTQCEHLRALLAIQTDQRLLDSLIEEGYAAHWPSGLLAQLRPARRRRVADTGDTHPDRTAPRIG